MQQHSIGGQVVPTFRRNRRTAIRIAAATALVATAAVAAFDSASAVHDAGALELDTGPDGANLVDDDLVDPQTDWAELFNADGSDSALIPPGYIDRSFDQDFVPGASGPDSSYFKPSTKDDQSINPTGKASEVWGCTTAANPTDKNDILNAYSLAVVAPTGPDAGDTILYTAGERFANDGTAFWGVWYFQELVGCQNTAGNATSFEGKKTENDVLLLINFDNGGTNITIDAFNWHPCDSTDPLNPISSSQCKTPADNAGWFTPALSGAVGGDCNAAAVGDDVCATVNRAEVTTTWPTQDKTSPANTLAISEFFESGFNLTDAFGVEQGDEPCFSSYLLETRSSSSIDATLKDFAGGSLNTCGNLTVTKYHDRNANGVDDGAGEEGLAGWTIFIDENGNEALDAGEVSGVTADGTGSLALGTVEFTDIKAGDISVCEVLQTGWINSDPGFGTPADPDGTTLCETATITIGGDSVADVGNYQPGSISGKKFQDDNEDGSQDEGEADLAGVLVHLFGSPSYGTAVHEHTTTAADGTYSFTGLQPGTYNVCETIPEGYKQTAPTSGYDCSTHDAAAHDDGDPGTTDLPGADGYGTQVVITSQAAVANVDFANAPLLGGIKIIKTRKHAADAQADPPIDPSPHAGVDFTITGGNLPAEGVTVTTGADGTVCYDGMVISDFVGDYTVTETVPDGYIADGDVAKTATVVESSCEDGNTVEVSFSNTPLTDVTVSVDSQIDGGTASTISCVDGDAAVVAEDLSNVATDDPDGGDVSVTATDLAPGTYVCTIVIDP